MAGQISANDGNGIAISATGNIKGITTEATDNFDMHILIGTGNKKGIVAFQSIDRE